MCAVINAESIMNKIFNSKRVSNAVKSGNAVPPREVVDEIVKLLRESLCECATGIAPSVSDDIYSLSFSGYMTSGTEEMMVINANFVNDLSRKSFKVDGGDIKYTGDGIDNIIALMNSGYALSGQRAYGIWEGHGDDIYVAPEIRDGMGFIKSGTDVFKKKAQKFGYKNIEVDWGEIYIMD